MIIGSSSCNPPDIEKILDTVLTKDNRRYYKVKWVKVTWETENDLAYFSNVIAQFWTEYQEENHLQSPAANEENPKLTHDATKEYESLFADHDGNQYESNMMESSRSDMFALSSSIMPAISDNLPPLTASSNKVESLLINIASEEQVQESEIEIVKELTKREIEHSCTICNQRFKKSKQLQRHMLVHRDKKCSICGKEFLRFGHLETHILTHSKLRPWACDQCEKAFTDKSSLRKHKLIHSNVRNYECSVCKQRFRRTEHLRRHVETKHDNVRNFKCDVCGKTFHQKSTLKTHLNIHSGEKPFTCSICGRNFADKATLTRHIGTHTGNKPYKCSECEKRYSRKHSLTCHHKKVHLMSDKSITTECKNMLDSNKEATIISKKKKNNFTKIIANVASDMATNDFKIVKT